MTATEPAAAAATIAGPAAAVVPVGLLLLGGVVMHLLPRTLVVGAVLLTAYLGGAVATNLRAEVPLLSTVLFPVYVAAATWLGLSAMPGSAPSSPPVDHSDTTGGAAVSELVKGPAFYFPAIEKKYGRPVAEW